MLTIHSFPYSERVAASLLLLASTACTGPLPSLFRLAQQVETFSSEQEVNTKIDLLWVVDNSASMDAAQEKIRKGFSTFAQRYLQPTWDIRLAVITTDTYLASESYQNYLETPIPSTVGWASTYIAQLGSQSAPLTAMDWLRWPSGDPSRNVQLIASPGGSFAQGLTYRQIVPVWGPQYARLNSGLHDGPTPALCSEAMPYFLNGATQCDEQETRTHESADSLIEACLDPASVGVASSVSRCVNTLLNSKIQSDSPIVETLPSSGAIASEEWVNQVHRNFMINVSTSTSGHGSERGIASVLQFLRDNESSESAFFRPNSLRGIIFVSDEDDQSLDESFLPITGDLTPWNHYRCDEASLDLLNTDPGVTQLGGYCCSDNSCRFGSEGTQCTEKTVDGLTYTPSICPDPTKLVSVESAKIEIDDFFNGLDQTTDSGESTFIAAITPLTATSISELQSARNSDDTTVGAIRTWAVDRGDRYLELAQLSGSGTLALDLGEEDYAPVLEAIGRAILEKKSKFTVARAPTSEEDLLLEILHADGTRTEIPSDRYVIEGKTIRITDDSITLSLKSDDQIRVDYQPSTLF